MENNEKNKINACTFWVSESLNDWNILLAVLPNTGSLWLL